MAETDRTSTRIATVRDFLGGIYGPDLHAKRINALSAATLGVMTGASLAVAAIGQALTLARRLTSVWLHGVKAGGIADKRPRLPCRALKDAIPPPTV